MKIPIIILAKNRPLQLSETIDSLSPVFHKISLIVCDNASNPAWMSGVWDKITQVGTLIKNKKDQGFIGVNPGLDLIGDAKYFVISDPDIILSPKMPPDWLDIMAGILDNYAIPKLGVALSMPDHYRNPMGVRVHECEARFWKMKYYLGIPDECYVAPVDTTFAMYRRDTFAAWFGRNPEITRDMVAGDCLNQDIYNPKYDMLRGFFPAYTTNCIRMAGRFTAQHTGWSTDERYNQENSDYFETCNKTLASTITWRKANGI